jgi:hypothetical protein
MDTDGIDVRAEQPANALAAMVFTSDPITDTSEEHPLKLDAPIVVTEERLIPVSPEFEKTPIPSVVILVVVKYLREDVPENA